MKCKVVKMTNARTNELCGFVIYAERTNLDNFVEDVGMVGYDNEPTACLDNAMLFDTKSEAEAWTKSTEAKEWIDCRFDICEVEFEQ